MADLLFEIGTEEIPAGFMPPAMSAMTAMAENLLEKNVLKHGEISATGTPRRLVLIVRDVTDEQERFKREVMGPARQAAFDGKGEPTKAAVGFARAQGVTPESLEIKETPRGEYVFAVREEGGRPAREILGEILPEIIASIPFPKSMRWGDMDVRFARPIHWFLALFGKETIPFEYAGLSSGNTSRGHRFMSPESFVVTGVDDYFRKTEEAMVIADHHRRRKMIDEILNKEAEANGGRVLEDPELLDTVNFLVEYPTATCGSFKEEYLELPSEVLITSMKSHQKYFPVVDDQGDLKPLFLTINNIVAQDMDVVRRGNERVLWARLADARFFYDEDLKVPLTEMLEELKRVLYHEKLGTSYEKVERFTAVALYLCRRYGLGDPPVVEKGAMLSKTDLVTEMVGEFPDLQGIMGKYYAMAAGESPEVSRAVYEHYLPRFAGDSLPESEAGAVISLADKMDTVAGSFGIGQKPTGSEDPYGLRRQTLGMINIILSLGLDIDLVDLVDRSVKELEGKTNLPAAEVTEEIVDFFRGRLLSMFVQEGHRHDVVEAVLSPGITSLVDVKERLEAISDLTARPEFEPLAVAFKRVVNIVPEGFRGKVDPALCRESAERELLRLYEEKGKDIRELEADRDYKAVLSELASIRPAVDEFFDSVMVMDEDETLRNNRLALMEALASLFAQVADFSKIAV
jgi:glycyl-tRNA synthetase beta chain